MIRSAGTVRRAATAAATAFLTTTNRKIIHISIIPSHLCVTCSTSRAFHHDGTASATFMTNRQHDDNNRRSCVGPPKALLSTTSPLNDDINNIQDSKKDDLCSSRGQRAVRLLPIYLTDARSVQKYHPVDAPSGALQLSVAENQMLEDLLEPAIQLFSSSSYPREGIVGNYSSGGGGGGAFRSDLIYYQPTHGIPSTRKAFAAYLHQVLHLPPNKQLDEDGLVVGAGCNAVLENLCLCLAERGDAILIPTPYYAAFEFDLVSRIDLSITPVTTFNHHSPIVPPSDSNKPIPEEAYYPNRSALDEAHNKAKGAGHEPKILLLSHPNNPLGVCYPPHVMKECIDWCRERQVHLISDEIYAGSVYRKQQKQKRQITDTDNDVFRSALTLAADQSTDDPMSKKGLGLGPYVHFVYALSKDFALSGLRVGVAYSENEHIRLPFQKLNDLCQVSSQTQLLVERMLTSSSSTINVQHDVEEEKKQEEGGLKSEGYWSQFFLAENQRRIRSRCDAIQECLGECDVPYLDATSGLFVWMDFREFLPPVDTKSSVADECESQERRERTLYLELMKEHGLLFTPGLSMRAERPGFFRCVFTAASDDEFSLGLERIRKFVAAKRGTDA